MSKSEKILIGTLVSIALINFYLQSSFGKKLDDIKNTIKETKM
jgi:hypothetical protein